MTTIFDGKKYAAVKEQLLKSELKKLNVKPKLVSILVGQDRASLLYTNLKKKAASRIGVKFIIKKFPENTDYKKIILIIKQLNDDKTVNGIMVQLPLPKNLKPKTRIILNSIAKNKDVDGLRVGSSFMPATVRAIKETINEATKDMPYFGKRATVVGAKGTVGKAVVKMLEDMNYKVCECDKNTRDLYAKLTNADLVVSATGQPGLVKKEMLKEGVIAIDVGAPVGDFGRGIASKAGFVTPVPGGIGPVTIACLLENLVETANE
jgi:methylenetetrahydrofolate dehydrogenase (NADP+) / methenyltetrahydrofolate cyclohydrolase